MVRAPLFHVKWLLTGNNLFLLLAVMKEVMLVHIKIARSYVDTVIYNRMLWSANILFAASFLI